MPCLPLALAARVLSTPPGSGRHSGVVFGTGCARGWSCNQYNFFYSISGACASTSSWAELRNFFPRGDEWVPQGRGTRWQVSASHCHCQKGCFCSLSENLPRLRGALALAWLDVAGKDACAGSVVLGFIILSPVLVLSPLPLVWVCSSSM